MRWNSKTMTDQQSKSSDTLSFELRDMSPASSRATRSTVPDDRILNLGEDSSSFSDDIPSCSGASGVSNNSDENAYNHNSEQSAQIERTQRTHGQEPPAPPERVVRTAKLKPDFRGIGITIAGGVYTPFGPDLLPVFITGVDPEGPAALTEQIKAGDQIIAVNGENMIGRTHRDVVLAVKKAGDDLTLDVTEGPEDIMRFVTFD